MITTAAFRRGDICFVGGVRKYMVDDFDKAMMANTLVTVLAGEDNLGFVLVKSKDSEEPELFLAEDLTIVVPAKLHVKDAVYVQSYYGDRTSAEHSNFIGKHHRIEAIYGSQGDYVLVDPTDPSRRCIFHRNDLVYVPEYPKLTVGDAVIVTNTDRPELDQIKELQDAGTVMYVKNIEERGGIESDLYSIRGSGTTIIFNRFELTHVPDPAMIDLGDFVRYKSMKRPGGYADGEPLQVIKIEDFTHEDGKIGSLLHYQRVKHGTTATAYDHEVSKLTKDEVYKMYKDNPNFQDDKMSIAMGKQGNVLDIVRTPNEDAWG